MSCGGGCHPGRGDRQPSRRLLAVLGHELRNPLGAALTGVELVDALCDDGDPRRPVLTRARQDLQRVTDLLEALLTFGTGGTLQGRRFDLSARLREVTGRRGGRVTLMAAEGIQLQGVPALIDRIVENLVDNALSAGAQRVVVGVQAAADGQTVEVRVQDNGAGIAPELVQSLFTNGVSGRGSTGIGLALARELARAHGGDLELVSTGPKASGAASAETDHTEFLLRLPLDVAEPQSGPTPPQAARAVLGKRVPRDSMAAS